MIYFNVDSPSLGNPNFNFLLGPVKKITLVLPNLSILIFCSPALGLSNYRRFCPGMIQMRTNFMMDDSVHCKMTFSNLKCWLLLWVEVWNMADWYQQIQTQIQTHVLKKTAQRIIANSVWMRKGIWDDDLSMISPRYDQKYWLLNNDPAVTVNNSQMSVATP